MKLNFNKMIFNMSCLIEPYETTRANLTNAWKLIMIDIWSIFKNDKGLILNGLYSPYILKGTLTDKFLTDFDRI